MGLVSQEGFGFCSKGVEGLEQESRVPSFLFYRGLNRRWKDCGAGAEDS